MSNKSNKKSRSNGWLYILRLVGLVWFSPQILGLVGQTLGNQAIAQAGQQIEKLKENLTSLAPDQPKTTSLSIEKLQLALKKTGVLTALEFRSNQVIELEVKGSNESWLFGWAREGKSNLIVNASLTGRVSYNIKDLVFSEFDSVKQVLTVRLSVAEVTVSDLSFSFGDINNGDLADRDKAVNVLFNALQSESSYFRGRVFASSALAKGKLESVAQESAKIQLTTLLETAIKFQDSNSQVKVVVMSSLTPATKYQIQQLKGDYPLKTSAFDYVQVENRINKKLNEAKLGTITISPVPAIVEIQDSAKIPTPQ